MDNERFVVTEDHIKLLQNMYVGWNNVEYGAPSIDGKRPYGDTCVDHSVAKILGWKFPSDYDDFYDRKCDELHVKVKKIHQEMETVLQILLRNSVSGIKPGVYVAEKYGTKWRLLYEKLGKTND